MADVLECTGVNEAVIWAIEKLELLCKKIGLCCNASRPCSFSKAECDAVPIYCSEGAVAAVDFKNIFESGFQLIADLKLRKRTYDDLDIQCRKAFEILNDFMKNKNFHEKSIQVLKNGDKLTEIEATTVLAEHLLSKLAPGQSYIVDKNCRSVDKHDYCQCGCGAKIRYGDTGIGHEEVWHGFIDIMFSSHEEVLAETVSSSHRELVPEIGVVTEPVAKKSKQESEDNETDIDEIEESPGQKSEKEKTEDLTNDKCPVDVQSDIDDNIYTEDQTIAKAIVFSFLQKQKCPDLKNFLIPTIVISREDFKIIMYDAENDGLLRSQPIKLFQTKDSTLLSTRCIVILWLILHYRMFCSGLKKINLRRDFQDLTKVKAGFKRKVTPEITQIYDSKLKSCVGLFPKVQRKGHIEDFCSFLINKKSDKFWLQME